MRPYFESEFENYVLKAIRKLSGLIYCTWNGYHIQAKIVPFQSANPGIVDITFNGLDDKCKLSCEYPIPSSVSSLIERIQEQIQGNDYRDSMYAQFRETADGIALQRQLADLEGYQFSERVDHPDFTGAKNYRIYGGWMYAECVGYDPGKTKPEEPHHVNLQRRCYEASPDEIQEWLTSYTKPLVLGTVNKT